MRGLVLERHQGLFNVIYAPKPGELRILLDLANDPRHDVQATSELETFGVVISEELYRRLQQYLSLSPKEPRKKRESA